MCCCYADRVICRCHFKETLDHEILYSKIGCSVKFYKSFLGGNLGHLESPLGKTTEIGNLKSNKQFESVVIIAGKYHCFGFLCSLKPNISSFCNFWKIDIYSTKCLTYRSTTDFIGTSRAQLNFIEFFLF